MTVDVGEPVSLVVTDRDPEMSFESDIDGESESESEMLWLIENVSVGDTC